MRIKPADASVSSRSFFFFLSDVCLCSFAFPRLVSPGRESVRLCTVRVRNTVRIHREIKKHDRVGESRSSAASRAPFAKDRARGRDHGLVARDWRGGDAHPSVLSHHLRRLSHVPLSAGDGGEEEDECPAPSVFCMQFSVVLCAAPHCTHACMSVCMRASKLLCA